MLPIVNNADEAYLDPAHWFEEAAEQELLIDAPQPLTMHLNSAIKGAIREVADAKGASKPSLMPEWIDEWLDSLE